MGQKHLLHFGPLLVPSTGSEHSRHTALEFGFGPTTNGYSSKITEPASRAFVAVAYRPIDLFC